MPKHKPSRASKMILDATLCPDGVYRITKPAEPKTHTRTFKFSVHSNTYKVSESPGTNDAIDALRSMWQIVNKWGSDETRPNHNTST